MRFRELWRRYRIRRAIREVELERMVRRACRAHVRLLFAELRDWTWAGDNFERARLEHARRQAVRSSRRLRRTDRRGRRGRLVQRALLELDRLT